MTSTPSGMPRVLVLATGGTIAGEAPDPTASEYTSGRVGIDALLAFRAPLPVAAGIEAEQLANVGSQDMDIHIWRALLERIRQAFRQHGADAVIITHGTDTAEETAFLLDLVLPAGPPVVLVSAMRPSNAIGADGPRNLVNAIRVASDPASRGRGVLAVSGDRLFAACDLYKAATLGTDAFMGFPGGLVGWVTPDTLRYQAAPSPAPWRGAYSFPERGGLPPVAILHVHADMDDAVTEAILSSGIAGVVLAGVGHGNAPRRLLARLAQAAAQGLAVVRASRINQGAVARNVEVDDDSSGFLAGGVLSPQKCRLLLQLLMVNGVTTRAARQAAFDRF